MRYTKTGELWGTRWNKVLSSFPTEEVRDLYRSGLSTRQIAATTGWSKSLIARACADISRSQRDAAILRQPPTSKHWRSCRAMARKIMQRHLGRTLESWEEVHHIDRDFTNNRLDNLEVLSSTEHRHHHRPPNPIPRHERPERKAWAVEYNNRSKVEHSCTWCKSKYRVSPRTINKNPEHCCSRSCGQKLSWQKRKSQTS